MKTILRAIFLNLLTLYLVNLFYPGFQISTEFKILLSAAIVWTLLNKVVKPIIKLLLLPINLITLGLFSWAINAITVFLLQLLIRGVTINPYTFPGFSYQGFIIPTIHLNLFFSYILTSLVLSLTHSSLRWLLKDD